MSFSKKARFGETEHEVVLLFVVFAVITGLALWWTI